MSKDYVLILIKANGCGACKQMESMWPSFESKIKAVHPGLRTQTVQFLDLNRSLDYTKYPYGLRNLPHAYPSFFLVPASLWDSAVSEIEKGKNNPVNFHIPTVKGLNYRLGKQDGRLAFLYELDPSKRSNVFNPDVVATWITNSTTKKEVEKKPKKEEKEKFEKEEKEEKKKIEKVEKEKVEIKYVSLHSLKTCPSYKLKHKK